MKTFILISLISILSYGQVDTTTISGSINIKYLTSWTSDSLIISWTSDSLGTPFLASTFKFPSSEELEEQYWDREKEKLSTIIGKYLKVKSKRIIGYNLITWRSVNSNYSSSVSTGIYFESEKQYAPLGNNYWIRTEFFNREDVILDFKNVKYAKSIVYNLDLKEILDVEPIYIDNEKSIEGFYNWLLKE